MVSGQWSDPLPHRTFIACSISITLQRVLVLHLVLTNMCCIYEAPDIVDMTFITQQVMVYNPLECRDAASDNVLKWVSSASSSRCMHNSTNMKGNFRIIFNLEIFKVTMFEN